MKSKSCLEVVDDFKDPNGKWVMTYTLNSIQYFTRACRIWHGIVARTKEGGYVQKKHTAYVGTVNKFVNFQEFTEWCQNQHGYTLKELNGRSWSLDKDLLSNGSSVYSPETCLFVPNYINCLLNTQKRKDRKYPLGVTSGTKGRFRAQIMPLNGKKKALGIFNDQWSAHRAYQKAKIQVMEEVLLDCSLGDKLLKFLRSYKEKLSYQYEMGIETTTNWNKIEFTV